MCSFFVIYDIFYIGDEMTETTIGYLKDYDIIDSFDDFADKQLKKVK